MLKHTIGLSLLCLVGNAYAANIVVTTTVDEDNTNPKACSLREAITLINGVNGKDILNSKEGYGGCGGEKKDPDNEGAFLSYSPIVELAEGEVYTLTKGQILIQKSISIQNATLNDTLDPLAKPNPVIQTTTTDRLFDINDGSPDSSSVQSVSFNQVDLRGCGALFSTAVSCGNNTNGGLISSNENLSLRRLTLSHGRAVKGGALYFPSAIDGQLSIAEVEMLNNQAEQGGVLWSAAPRFNVAASLFYQNKATGALGSLLYTELQGKTTLEDGTQAQGISRESQVTASTFYENQGFAVTLRANMLLNSNTIVNNSVGGVYFDSRSFANAANNIIANNAGNDCQFAANDQSYLNHNVYTFGCESKPASYSLSQTKISNSGNQTLIADANNDGICDLAPAVGLLCPLTRGAQDFTRSLVPRLLSTYRRLDESPIVNKGPRSNTNNKLFACSGADQRNKSRGFCDIGAIELVSQSTASIGKDILYGQVAVFDLRPFLGDGELMPKESCEALYPNGMPKTGWVDGCIRFTKAPLKGKSVIADNRYILTYTPTRNFHGFDRYNFDVTTTTSRFSNGDNDAVTNIKATIVQEPPNDFVNKTVKLKGGSAGILSLLTLTGLALLRRRRRRIDNNSICSKGAH